MEAILGEQFAVDKLSVQHVRTAVSDRLVDEVALSLSEDVVGEQGSLATEAHLPDEWAFVLVEEGQTREADAHSSFKHEDHLVYELALLADNGVFRVVGNEPSRLEASIQGIHEFFVMLDRLEKGCKDVSIHVIADDLLLDRQRQVFDFWRADEPHGLSVLIYDSGKTHQADAYVLLVFVLAMSQDGHAVILPIVLQHRVNFLVEAVSHEAGKASTALLPVVETLLVIRSVALNHRHQHAHGVGEDGDAA